ncbi:peptide-methionine (S)-S-oxide reductase MsrA [Sneathiella chinensis]|uniref:Peptide methionine sulfoxide reductase MsrA n=1 Tax=Sneathiella chinensis TaxID=349750 RepID=A0ABQ5U7E7_9PROT|nr:peptide-methionine (S)-S-oxide reductase MsrA [Sneathiella chinensis]GLQ07194.1 peptide methionine sulfoxide reductase MsrA [Sneathiella chinensis]
MTTDQTRTDLKKTDSQTSETKRTVLAGGCFWGMQDLIRARPGVLATRVGYTGGTLKHPRYQDLKFGGTGHAEAVEIVYDPAQTNFEDILAFFFQIHDPTTPNRQGNDMGSQYRSIIFVNDEEEERSARAAMDALEKAQVLPGPIVTEILPIMDFWPAEPEHQDYLQKFPSGYTCHFIRPTWKLPS